MEEEAIFIKETNPQQNLILNSPLLALAQIFNIRRDVTKCSL